MILLPNDRPIQRPADAIPLVATLIAALLMWSSKSLLATIIVGIGTFLILRGALAFFG